MNLMTSIIVKFACPYVPLWSLDCYIAEY